MYKVLVTGANGFIGRAVLARLHQEGVAAVGLSRRLNVANGVTGDLRDGNLASYLQGFDTVVHCAFEAGNWRANLSINRNLIEALRRSEVKHFVHLSTVSVFDQRITGLLTIDSPLTRAGDDYAVAKRDIEQRLRNFAEESRACRVTILYPTIVLGVGGFWSEFIFSKVLHRTVRLPLAGDLLCNAVHVSDVALLVQHAVTASPALPGLPFRAFANAASLPWAEVYRSHRNALRSGGFHDEIEFSACMSLRPYARSAIKNAAYFLRFRPPAKNILAAYRRFRGVPTRQSPGIPAALQTPVPMEVEVTGMPRLAHMTRYEVDLTETRVLQRGVELAHTANALSARLIADQEEGAVNKL